MNVAHRAPAVQRFNDCSRRVVVEQVRILFLASNPIASNFLALDTEVRDITAKIRMSEFRDVLDLKPRWAVRFDDVLHALHEDHPTIVHFSGHGTEQSGLVFHGHNGEPKTISAETMKDLFSTLKKDIQVVVLSACHSDEQARVIADVVDCVIGMKAAVSDVAACTFAPAFYRALGFGESVHAAFKVGRIAIAAEGLPEADLPRLFSRPGVDADKIFLVDPVVEAAPASIAGSLR